MPVDVEAENVFVETVFGGAVAHDEAGMDDTHIGGGQRSCGVRLPLKADSVPLRVHYYEVFVTGTFDFRYWYLLRREVLLQTRV